MKDFKGIGEGLLNGVSGLISNMGVAKVQNLHWNEWLKHNADQEIRKDGYWEGHLCGLGPSL